MVVETLRSFLTELCAGRIIARPPDEPWAAMIARTAQTGVVCAIDEETYVYFLEGEAHHLLAVHFLGHREGHHQAIDILIVTHVGFYFSSLLGAAPHI